MAWSSVGYAGTVNDRQWAGMHPRVGLSAYGVSGFSHWRVTAAAGTRVVQVAAGTGWGRGIVDTTDAVEVLPSLASVPSGTRWDLIVARRDWDAKATTFKVVAGGSSKAIPPRTVSTWGGVDEQPIALVRVTAGSTAIAEIVDLRVFPGAGGVVARDELVMQYLADVGTTLRIGDTTFTRVVNSSGSATWSRSDAVDSGWIAVPRGPKWAAVANYPLEVRKVGNLVELRGAVLSQDGASKNHLASLPAGFRPKGFTPLGMTQTNSLAWGEVFVNSVGKVWMDAEYRTGDNPGNEVVMIHGFWFLG